MRIAISPQLTQSLQRKAIRVIVLEDNQAQQAAEPKPNNTHSLDSEKSK